MSVNSCIPPIITTSGIHQYCLSSMQFYSLGQITYAQKIDAQMRDRFSPRDDMMNRETIKNTTRFIIKPIVRKTEKFNKCIFNQNFENTAIHVTNRFFSPSFAFKVW